MRTVLRTEIVPLVHAEFRVPVIVEQVRRAVGEDEAEGHEGEPSEIHRTDEGREEAANQGREESHDQDGAPRGDQPLGDGIELLPFGPFNPGDHAERGQYEHSGYRYNHSGRVRQLLQPLSCPESSARVQSFQRD